MRENYGIRTPGSVSPWRPLVWGGGGSDQKEPSGDSGTSSNTTARGVLGDKHSRGTSAVEISAGPHPNHQGSKTEASVPEQQRILGTT